MFACYRKPIRIMLLIAIRRQPFWLRPVVKPRHQHKWVLKLNCSLMSRLLSLSNLGPSPTLALLKFQKSTSQKSTIFVISMATISQVRSATKSTAVPATLFRSSNPWRIVWRWSSARTLPLSLPSSSSLATTLMKAAKVAGPCSMDTLSRMHTWSRKSARRTVDPRMVTIANSIRSANLMPRSPVVSSLRCPWLRTVWTRN